MYIEFGLSKFQKQVLMAMYMDLECSFSVHLLQVKVILGSTFPAPRNMCGRCKLRVQQSFRLCEILRSDLHKVLTQIRHSVQQQSNTYTVHVPGIEIKTCQSKSQRKYQLNYAVRHPKRKLSLWWSLPLKYMHLECSFSFHVFFLGDTFMYLILWRKNNFLQWTSISYSIDTFVIFLIAN